MSWSLGGVWMGRAPLLYAGYFRRAALVLKMVLNMGHPSLRESGRRLRI